MKAPQTENRQKLIAFFQLLGREGFHAEHHNLIEKLTRTHNDDPVADDARVDCIVDGALRIFAAPEEPEPAMLAPEVALKGVRVLKKYPCGCIAGPGPADLPDYCEEHGNPLDTSGCVVTPYVEAPEQTA